MTRTYGPDRMTVEDLRHITESVHGLDFFPAPQHETIIRALPDIIAALAEPTEADVERVARAICVAERMNDEDALGGWHHWTEAARAAIAALRKEKG
jgi:hypothetical protein